MTCSIIHNNVCCYFHREGVPLSSRLLKYSITFRDLSKYFYDLNSWRMRSTKGRACDFTMLDKDNGAGWDLACKLVTRRNSFLRYRINGYEKEANTRNCTMNGVTFCVEIRNDALFIKGDSLLLFAYCLIWLLCSVYP